VSDTEINAKVEAMRRWKRERQTSEPLPAKIDDGAYDPCRYARLDDRQIARQLRHIHSRLLMRGRLETILARRENGGLLTEFARHHDRDRAAFAAFATQTVGLDYTDAMAQH
jgi:hypothetical protein